jgi:hypothetical protein
MTAKTGFAGGQGETPSIWMIQTNLQPCAQSSNPADTHRLAEQGVNGIRNNDTS